MPLFKYILLALLGLSGTALSADVPITPASTTLDADAIVQPNGGALSNVYPGQKKPRNVDSTYVRKRQRGRHHKVYQHTVKQPRTPKKEG